MNTVNEQRALDGTGASIEQDWGGHPLFPRAATETEPDRRRFDIILVYRWLPDGTREVCPRAWKGSELRSWEQIIEAYGGECTYEVVAQCAASYQIQARSEPMYFGGPARKPFHPAPKPPTPAIPVPATAPQPPNQQSDLMGLLMLMLEHQARMTDRMHEREMRMMDTMFQREARIAESSGGREPLGAGIQPTIEEMLLRAMRERPPQPNPAEILRELVPLMQSMNKNPAPTVDAPEAAKLVEEGIAMGRAKSGRTGRERSKAFPWAALISVVLVGLNALAESRAEEEEENAKAKKAKEANPTPSPKQPRAPAPVAPHLQTIFVDPSTGWPYTFVPGVGYVWLDPAMAFAQAYGQHRPLAPVPYSPYPYAYPFGMPTPAVHQPMPAPVAQEVPFAAQRMPIAPPAPATSQPAPATPPAPSAPTTIRMPHPVARAMPSPSSPETVRTEPPPAVGRPSPRAAPPGRRIAPQAQPAPPSVVAIEPQSSPWSFESLLANSHGPPESAESVSVLCVARRNGSRIGVTSRVQLVRQVVAQRHWQTQRGRRRSAH